jgi:hypothetical protein
MTKYQFVRRDGAEFVKLAACDRVQPGAKNRTRLRGGLARLKSAFSPQRTGPKRNRVSGELGGSRRDRLGGSVRQRREGVAIVTISCDVSDQWIVMQLQIPTILSRVTVVTTVAVLGKRRTPRVEAATGRGAG